MLSFLSILAEVVLPRVKDFEGVHYVQSEKSGSINFGFPGAAMSLFPQIEGNRFYHQLTNSQFRFVYKFTWIRYIYRNELFDNSRCTNIIIGVWNPF